MDVLDTWFDTEDNDEEKKITSKDKSWHTAWERAQEMNLLALGKKRVRNPYEQSYIVYRAIRVIADNIPQAKFKIYKGNIEVEDTNPIYNLWTKPNSFMSRWDLWEAIAVYLNLKGECFVILNESLGQRVGTSKLPSELVPVNPYYMKHVVEKGNLIGWKYEINGKTDFFLPQEVLHFKHYNPNNPFRGLTPLASINSEMEADHSAGLYNKTFFDNNATPDGVVEVNQDSNYDVQQLRELKRLWNENNQGINNSHKVAFLLGGMSYKSMGVVHKEMEYVQGRKFSREAILSVFGIPPFISGLGDNDVNRSTANAAMRLLWRSTLIPQLKKIEEKVNKDFFMELAPQYRCKFDYDNIPELRPDTNESIEAARNLWSMGYSRNEVNDRFELGMPEDGDTGDIRYQPMNLIAVDGDQTIQPKVNNSNEPEKIKGLNKAVRDSYRRNFLIVQDKFEKRIESKIKRYIRENRLNVLNILKNKTGLELQSEINSLIGPQKERLKELVTPEYRGTIQAAAELAINTIGIQRSFSSNTKQDIVFDDLTFEVDDRILNNRLNTITGVTDTIYSKVKKEVNESLNSGESIQQLSSRVKKVFSVSTNRSFIIARTESASLMNGTSLEVYKNNGVTQKEWIAQIDDATRDSHVDIDGEIITMSSVFSNNLSYPGDPSGPASEVVNCRCTIAPHIE